MRAFLARPALAGALKRLATGEAEALLVVKLDRLTRSVVALSALVDRCNKQGWVLLSVSGRCCQLGEQIDTRTAAGRMVLNILATIGQWEREAIGERTAAALAHKKTKGERVGQIPYGWSLATDGVHLDPHHAEQEVIRLARELREAGLSLRKVGAALERKGLLPRTGKRWHAQTVKSLLAADLA